MKLILLKHKGSVHVCTHAVMKTCMCMWALWCACVRLCLHMVTVQPHTDGWDFIMFIQGCYNQVTNTWTEPQVLGNSGTNFMPSAELPCAVCNAFWIGQLLISDTLQGTGHSALSGSVQPAFPSLLKSSIGNPPSSGMHWRWVLLIQFGESDQ